MNLKNTFKYHALLAIIIMFMHLFDEYNTMGSELFFKELPLGILYLITFYIAFFGAYIYNYTFICPQTLAKKKIVTFVLGLLSLFLVFAAIRYVVEEVLVYSITSFHNYPDHTRTFWYYIFDNAYYALKAALFSTFMFFLFNYLRSTSKIHKLELAHQQAALASLKTQLEPHFLFNTLNVFYSELAETQPETAKGIFKLSELLRYLTYETKKDFMPLEKELKFIEDYIYFYEKRFEANFFLDFNVIGDVHQQKIPALLLIHFVENIFKHGSINDKTSPAVCTIEIEEEHLSISTKNKIANVKNYSSSGVGRENLIKRLQLLFENDYNYNYQEQNGIYKTYLKIPLKK